MAMAESSELAQRLQRTLGDGFRVERELGGGGMSRVFLVEDIQLDRRIVVKVLPPELGASLSVERFRREIQLAAKLQHPHVVPLLTAGANEGLLYFAMPYIEGESLRARLAREHELPIQDSVRILRDVTDALAYAHAHGVVHRDIKPDNVLVSGHHALVTDFGVSKALANSAGASSITSVGIALGTPAYMSPEQAAADPAADHRADIYAVGVLGYELLTGRTPFGGLPPQQQLAAHVTTPTPHISQHRASLPPALAGVIMRCLEKKAADRWQTADELVEQFEALATPSGGLTPAGSPPHQRARLTSLRVGVAAAVVVVVGATSWLVWRRPSGYVVASTTQVTNTPGLELDATISPDGKLVAFAMGSVGHSRIYVKQIAGGSARALAESAAEPQRMPRWSPDGQQISFDVRQALYTSPALGGTPRQLMDASEYEFASPTLSPDGERIAYAREDGIYVRPVNGGDAVKIAAATWPNWPVWSPDGHRVAFVENNPWFLSSGAMLGNIAPSTIYVADVSARKAVAVTERVHLNTSPAWAGDGRALLYVSSRGGSRDIYRQGLTRRGEAQGLRFASPLAQMLTPSRCLPMDRDSRIRRSPRTRIYGGHRSPRTERRHSARRSPSRMRIRRSKRLPFRQTASGSRTTPIGKGHSTSTRFRSMAASRFNSRATPLMISVPHGRAMDDSSRTIRGTREIVTCSSSVRTVRIRTTSLARPAMRWGRSSRAIAERFFSSPITPGGGRCTPWSGNRMERGARRASSPTILGTAADGRPTAAVCSTCH